jgi:membrane-anchored glycerophosphoryl diester phosphodiesterase (GDPDase)
LKLYFAKLPVESTSNSIVYGVGELVVVISALFVLAGIVKLMFEMDAADNLAANAVTKLA